MRKQLQALEEAKKYIDKNGDVPIYTNSKAMAGMLKTAYPKLDIIYTETVLDDPTQITMRQMENGLRIDELTIKKGVLKYGKHP